MKIKKLILHGFKKHAHLELDFCDSVNVLFGMGGAGKSCCIKALNWVLFNAKVDNIIRQGEAQASVKVIFENDVEVERVRSKTINRYIIKKDGEDRIFDSIGKEIPAEVKEVIGLSPLTIDGEDLNLNIAPQISLPFLQDKPASFKAKLFNVLTGNDLIDTLLGDLSKDALRLKKGIKEANESIETLQKEQLISNEQTQKKQAVYAKLSVLKESLQEKDKKIQTSTKFLTEINRLEQQIEATNNELSIISLPKENHVKRIDEKIKKLGKIIDLKEEYDSILDYTKEVEATLKEYSNLSKIETTEIDKKLEQIKKQSELLSKLNKAIEQEKELTEEFVLAEKNLEEEIKKAKDFLKRIQICPICETAISEEKMSCLEI